MKTSTHRRRARPVWIAALVALAAPAAAGPPSAGGERLLALVGEIVAFGPRSPGTPGHDAAREFLVASLRKTGAAVSEQRLRVRAPTGEWHPAANIIARIRPEATDRVLIGAHWDTRPRADRDPDPARREEPIVGANDGGSGTALLLHLAELLAADPPPVGVDLVFFDAEDWGVEGDHANYCLGAKHYARLLDPAAAPRAGLVVDMIGKRDLYLRREEQSVRCAPGLVERIWAIAAETGAYVFADEAGGPVYDDHLPLIEVGVPAILLIDLDYPAWHTHEDTLEQLSGRSMAQVTTVLLTWLYRGAPQ